MDTVGSGAAPDGASPCPPSSWTRRSSLLCWIWAENVGPGNLPLFFEDNAGTAPMFQTPQAMFCSCHFQFRHTPYTALGTPPAPSHPHPPVVTRACPVAYNL